MHFCNSSHFDLRERHTRYTRIYQQTYRENRYTRMDLELNAKRHTKFIERHLAILPAVYQSGDPNKMAVIFYSLGSLALLNPTSVLNYRDSIPWICQHSVKMALNKGSKGYNGVLCGFVGSSSVNIPNTYTMSLTNTFFALLSLLILDAREFYEDVSIKEGICNFVSKCQLHDKGAFVSVLDYKSGEPSIVDGHDLRFSYIAVAILYILGCRTEEQFKQYIDVNALVRYILSQSCDSGAFGVLGEPHAGYTSCALSALQLLGKLDALTPSFKNKTVEWLLERQVSKDGCFKLEDISNENFDAMDHGGFQGRENKFADTCYVFWCLNSLQLLTKEWKALCQTELAKSFLLDRTQDTLVGGFKKNDEDDPDIYHTCLGFAALKLIDGGLNGALCIPKFVAERYNL